MHGTDTIFDSKQTQQVWQLQFLAQTNHDDVVPCPGDATMAPKEWADRVTLSYDTLCHIIQENTKLLERLAWKAMDAEEFMEHFSTLMRAFARHTIRLSRPDVRQALCDLKVTMSPSEQDLFVEKLAGAWKYIKRRHRDASSKRFMPSTSMAVYKLWQRHHGKKSRTKEKLKQKVKDGVAAEPAQECEEQAEPAQECEEKCRGASPPFLGLKSQRFAIVQATFLSFTWFLLQNFCHSFGFLLPS